MLSPLLFATLRKVNLSVQILMILGNWSLGSLPTNSSITFWDFLMFYQIFHSPQVKRWAIITYKHGIYE